MEILSNTEALDHCRQLSNLIDAAVDKSTHGLFFSEFMNFALYAQGLGYYTAGAYKFGQKGDFITAPEISPWFGATIAQTIAPVLQHFRSSRHSARILEFGAGSGALAKSVLQQLQIMGTLPDVYQILEVSPDLIDRQQSLLLKFKQEHQIPTAIEWLQVMPPEFDGVILANEVIDAFPIDVIVKREDGWYYRCVGKNPAASLPDFSDHWQWQDGPKVPLDELPSYLLENDEQFVLGYQTEIHAQALAWIEQIAQHLRQGMLLTIDYGFPEKEYYHPQRTSGTLIAHHQHHSIDQVFYLPGLCDLTAHVEWSGLNLRAQKKGFQLIAYLSQGAYLLEAGIGQLLLANADVHDPLTFLPQSNALQKLLSEAEMGELFKVCAWSMNRLQDPTLQTVCEQLPGFTGRMRLL